MEAAPRWPGPELGGALAVACLGLALVLGLGVAGWPGEPYDCLESPCFCERAVPGPARQPSNTWSNLAVVALGVGLGAQAGRRRLARARPRPELDLLGRLAPPVVVAQGLGSMLFHGGLTRWGSTLDAVSMFATVGLLLGTNLLRLGWLAPRGLRLAWAGTLALGAGAALAFPAAVTGLVFAFFLGILVSEVLLTRRGRTPRPGLFRLALALHLLGVAVWFFSAAEGLPLCWPDSPWQGHALWHLTAGAAVTLFAVHASRSLEAQGPDTGVRR